MIQESLRPTRIVSRGWIPVLLALALTPTAGEARLYRWVDQDGVVHYTDQIPPSEIERGRSELNRQGIRVEDVPPARSLEEIQRERELERLRKQQERLVEQQNAADRVLLRSFRSVDDLIMARDGKLAAIDVMVGVARGSIRRQQEWLRKLQTQAADLERTGEPVPENLVERIAKTERAIEDSYAAIIKRQTQQEAIRRDFDRDLKRFRQLKDIPEDSAEVQASAQAPTLRNLIACDSQEECRQYWSRALAFVRSKATTPIQTSGPNILITAPPETRDDLSLTLSRIQEEKGGGGAYLFLDIQCKRQGANDRRCTEDQERKLLEEFQLRVMGLAGDAAPPHPSDQIPSAPAGKAAPRQ